MIRLRLACLGILLCLPSLATLVPSPNLEKRIESSDAIIVGTLIRGMTTASGDRVSTDLVLKVDRVLKGNLMAGDEATAHLEGRAAFIAPAVTTKPIEQRFHGIWLLKGTALPYTVISRDGNSGELGWAVVSLPESAPPGAIGKTPAESVANELAAALRWLAPQSAESLLDLAMSFATLEAGQTIPWYREFSGAGAARLRVVGIQGLIAANQPDGPVKAAADWADLAGKADIHPIVNAVMQYSNEDPAAIGALAALAARPDAEAGLRENVAYALRAIHTRAALPGLAALLDDPSARARSYALSGLCLFVRNAPTVTPQSIPSMSWMQVRQPTPFLTPETEPHCLLGGMAPDADSHILFWKSWWAQHAAAISDSPRNP
ncbi:MAG: hypothetical protein C5B56_05760 [Proteobacteria bacterium]|nr:MAG: hypothetical protein C5B56_05760 [Pseudomonadota bacterium]